MSGFPSPSPEALDMVQQRLMQLPGVAAVGQTEHQGRVALRVYFVDAAAAEAASLPAEIDSVAIDSVVSGAFEAGDLDAR